MSEVRSAKGQAGTSLPANCRRWLRKWASPVPVVGPLFIAQIKGLGMWLLKGPQTELAATPVLLTRHLCVAFILLSLSGQRTESQPPMEPARNSGQVCPEWVDGRQAHMWFQGEQLKAIFYGEMLQGNIIDIWLSHFGEKETSVSWYLCEMIFLFLRVLSQRPFLTNCSQGRIVWNKQIHMHHSKDQLVNQLFLEVLSLMKY